jgi:NAD(P)H-dependent flavin oxidoreductase YrpB (nitropropane dioxygenase family)
VTRLTELLHCELAMQLAPMGSVSATPRLPLAVAAGGAHAVYPGLGLPPQALAPVLDSLAAETDSFGVNFIVPLMNRESLELAAERAPYVDFFLTEPDPGLVEAVRSAGAVCGWQVEAVDEARAAEEAGCELVIAKGHESGGRKRIEGPELRPLLEATRAAVSIPVIAAGGIATAQDVASAFASGADGVRIGTRFIASAESDAHPAWIQAVLDASAEDSVVTDAFNNGMPQPGPHRVLRSSIEAAEALSEDEQVGILRMAGAEIPVGRFAPQPPTRDSTGHVEAMPFYAGRSAGAVTSVEPAAEIVQDLATGIP